MDFQNTVNSTHVRNQLDLSFNAVKGLYLSVMIIYPLVGFIYPLFQESTTDPMVMRFVIAFAIGVVYVLAQKYDAVSKRISTYSIILYYLISAHALYLISINEMSAPYVTAIIIIVGTGHVVFNSFRQISLFLIFLLIASGIVIYHVSEPRISPGIFFISVLLIGFFAFISLRIRFNLSKRLLLSSFIVDNVNEGILIVSMDDIVTYANTGIRDILGYTEQELLGRDIKDYLASQSDREIVLGKTDVRSRGISDKYELNFRHKNGRTIQVEVSGNPTYNNRGIADGSVSVITDITSRKNAEKELKRLSLVASKTDNYVIMTDEKDEVIWVNEGFEKITGYTLSEIKGKQPDTFLYEPETDARVIEKIRLEKRSGQSFYEEIQSRTKSDEVKWLSLNVTPLKNEDGSITGYIIIGNDISTKKTAEENLKQSAFRSDVIRQIDQAIIASETLPALANTTIKYIIKLLPRCSNASLFLKNTDSNNYETLASVLDTDLTYRKLPGKIQDILHAGYPYLVSDMVKVRNPLDLENDLAEKGFNAYVFIPLIYGRELLGTLNVFWNEKNPKIAEDVEMLEGIARDLAISIRQFSLQTTLSARNRELKSNLRELKATHEELQSFSYVVSHDLKAPLRAISSLTNWLISDYSSKIDNEGREYLDLLLNRTKRMHNLIDGILQYSRIGRMNIQVSAIDSREVLINIIDILSPPENIEFRIDDSLPVVNYNTVQLQQVFQNLISNAIKFMNKENGLIRIGYVEKDGMYEFFVKDNGPGIDSGHHDKIFKIFQTISTKDELESTGIGLTIVKKIVELNGGEVWVESVVDEGTTFYFTVPKRKNVSRAPEKQTKKTRQ